MSGRAQRRARRTTRSQRRRPPSPKASAKGKKWAGGGGKRAQASGPSRRGYDPSAADPRDSEYHYGSDFGDESDDESCASEPAAESSESSPSEPDADSDGDFSPELRASPACERRAWRPPSPEPPWLALGPRDLELPDSSDDLPIERALVARLVAVYETLRRFRHAVRLSPFRLEDLCAAIACSEQSSLLIETHVAPLKALLREEDTQQTHFGPLDHRDSVNVALYLLDSTTWPETLRSYVDSDPSFDRAAKEILDSREYPFCAPEDRIKVLEFLCDRFLATNSVREDLTSEVAIHYDDHCRSCHRLGDLLCCETCPAVYHLECVDPPLVDVPSEDWQCSLCRSHRVSGVTDCVSSAEKRGLLCRHEHLGYDRRGRKYWFLCRRMFVEDEDGTLRYYSSIPQFEELLNALDPNDLESALCRELAELGPEIRRQMQITEDVTNELKGNRRSYLEVENSTILKARRKRDGVEETEEPEANGESEQNDIKVDEESESKNEDDEASKKADDKLSQIDALESQRLTRLKVNQITSGTFLFKLGNDNAFKNYVNQYSMNPMALNKPQRNEERDKKRHLAHKFSLSCAQDFKWIGNFNVSRLQLVNCLRQTILHLENSIASVFMHPNWSLLRKPWLQAVHVSNIPRDFARALVVLQACIKSVVFVPAWHEQLGHVRLQRITAAEREERKKADKREKKEKDEEEEKNKVSFFVKYPIHLKHQIWKQKGEEYRIHAQWGWLWNSATRKYRNPPNVRPDLSHGPQKYSIRVNLNDSDKIISVEPKTYEYLCNRNTDLDITDRVPQDVKRLKMIRQPNTFDEIDVERALTASARLFYPKVARKCRIDDLLPRRVRLKTLEERNFDLKTETKEEDEQQHVDIENDENENDSTGLSNDSSKDTITSLTKEIQTLRQRYAETLQLARGYECYTKQCNANAATLSQNFVFTSNCYSPLCIRKANLRKDLLILLNKIRNSTNAYNNVKDFKHTSLWHGSSKTDKNSEEYTSDVIKDLVSAVSTAQCVDEKSMLGYVKLDIKQEAEDVKPKIEGDESCDFTDRIKSEQMLEESVIPAIGNEMELDAEEPCLDVENDVETTERRSKRERKYRDVSVIKSDADLENDDNGRPPIPKLRIFTRGRVKGVAVSEENKKSCAPSYRALYNRRFCASNRISAKKEEVKDEIGPDGTVKIYSATSTAKKIYLKRLASDLKNKKKRIPVKYPLCSTFHTKSKAKSIMVLPAHELRKLSRHGGRLQVNGFNHNSKPNPCIWPYPCSRPLFKTCWLYRTINYSSLAAIALQIRILWACIRWDDMATKPSNSDGKNQITTETEIITLEMLKHRHVGQFLDKTQYLRRKVVIPLEVPKTVREVTSIRSGLRKRKRAESPQSMEPQVTEEWVDEDKLELWEIRQYGERVERAVPVTRTTTGKLPPARNMQESRENSPVNSISRVSAQEIKDKMEQQLRLQRAAHQQKRALELAQGSGTPVAGKAVIGARRVFMTKNVDGTTRVITQPGTLSKVQLAQASPSGQQQQQQQQLQQTKTPTAAQLPKDGPQKVQIIRGPDGKITVRGLIAGQQLIQMPDGKLHVIASGQQGNIPTGGTVIATGGAAPTPKIAVTSAVRPNTTPLKANTINNSAVPQPANKVVIKQQMPLKTLVATPDGKQPQNVVAQPAAAAGQRILVQGNQQIIMQSPQHLIMQGQQRPVVQVSQGTVLQNVPRPLQAVVVQGNPAPIVQNQIIRATVPNTSSSAPTSQQQHILINSPSLMHQLSAGKLQLANINGQQILVRPIGNNQAVIVAHVHSQANQVNNVVSTADQPSPNVAPVAPVVPVAQPPPLTQAAAPLTEDQLMEQRLLAGQPPGTVIRTVTAQVLHLEGGPRIVLQGLQGNSLTQQQLQLVQHQVKQQLLKAQESTGKQGMLGPTKLYLAVQPSTGVANSAPIVARTVQQMSQDKTNLKNTVLVNGQDSLESSVKIGSDKDPNGSSANKFVLTPDYIQQTIKNALKQENLNPEIEEKLLQLQRYQERQMKPENGNGSNDIITRDTRSLSNSSSGITSSSRKRPTSGRNTDDEEWVESTPRKRNRPSAAHHERNEVIDESRSRENNFTRSSRPIRSSVQQNITTVHHHHQSYSTSPSPVDERRRAAHHSKLPLILFRQKELLKKDIIKKRSLLEKELGIEIQKELSTELAMRTKAERNKQEEVRVNNTTSNMASNNPRRRSHQGSAGAIKHPIAQNNSSSRSKQRKKEKLLCVCQTPYDDTKFYVACEHCNNWFHGDCVGITEEMSKTINEFVCAECKHAQDTQVLYCLCRQPYDNSQFYICCDRCQDWFHGRCVGILQSEADNIDEYICPNCQKNNTVNLANMKELSSRDFENLKKFVKQIQLHKSAWPFMDPVDPREAPMYYKVIKEPMDLKIIEKKINEETYNNLSEFIADMTKIFDNCKYFNPKESQFYRCAENLEAFFVQKIKYFREKLLESSAQR